MQNATINIWQHSATMYIAEAKCLMSHQYPNGPTAEYSRRRCAWQRWRTPNKRVDSGDGYWGTTKRKELNPIDSFSSNGEAIRSKCNRAVRLTSETDSDTRRSKEAIKDQKTAIHEDQTAIKRRHLLINILLA